MSHNNHKASAVRPEDRVPLKQKIAWGAGGAADYMIINVLSALAMPIFNVALGLNAVLVGLALAIPRLLDAFGDPIVGHLSDITRSRWGRRRPWIFVGTLLAASTTVLMWLPSHGWSQSALFAWLLFFAIMSQAVAFPVFSIPYNTLGLEMTPDYHERTKVLTWRFYAAQSVGLSAPWLYWLALRPVFGGDEVVGVRWVAAAAAVVILVSGLSPALFTRERPGGQRKEGMRFWASFKATWRNSPFRTLVVSNLLLKLGLYMAGSYSFYITLFYVCRSDKVMTGVIAGLVGTMLTILGIPAMPIATWVSGRLGKKNTTALALGVAALAHASMWWTITPTAPYLQLVSYFVAGITLNMCWVLIGSMVGDICEEDEVATGHRREGMYWSAFLFSDKVAMSLMTLLTGVLLKVCGFVEGQEPTEQTVTWLRVLFVVLQAGGLLAGALFMLRFPITPARAAETRRKLEAIRSNPITP
jgi:GPH family glycoside/pentoside/hexuronide:cation symporter